MAVSRTHFMPKGKAQVGKIGKPRKIDPNDPNLTHQQKYAVEYRNRPEVIAHKKEYNHNYYQDEEVKKRRAEKGTEYYNTHPKVREDQKKNRLARKAKDPKAYRRARADYQIKFRAKKKAEKLALS